MESAVQCSSKTVIRRAEIILLGIVIVWGLNVPVMKIGLQSLSPVIYNAARLTIAALLALAALGVSKAYRPMSAGDIKQLAALSIAGFFFNQVMVIYGMDMTTAGNSSLVLATLPVEIALINRICKIEYISRPMAAGILIGLTGVFLVVWGSNHELSFFGPHMTGAALLLAGQFCYAYYTVFAKTLIGKYSIYQIIACVLAVNAVLFALMAAPDMGKLAVAGIPPGAWMSMLFSAAFGLFMSNFIWVWVVGILGSTKASLSQYLCPVLSIAFACLFLGETFGYLQMMGAAVIFLGLYLTHKETK